MKISLIAGKATPRVTALAEGLRRLGHTVTESGALAACSIAWVEGDARAALDPGALATVRRVIVPSEHVALTCGVDIGRVTVLAPGIDDRPRSTGSAGPTCEILAAGALRPDKGQDILLRALCRLFDLDWHLTIAGDAADPAFEQRLRALAQELDVAAQVSFVPDPPAGTLEALWQGADLFALTPHEASYGSVFAEALRRGLPVAATAVGAVQSFVGPDAGVVCAPADIDQLAKALRRLIFDAPLRRDIAEVAWQTGRTLPSWDEQAARLADLLAE